MTMEYPQSSKEKEAFRKQLVDDMKVRQLSGDTGLDAIIIMAECQHEFGPIGSDEEMLFCHKCRLFIPGP